MHDQVCRPYSVKRSRPRAVCKRSLCSWLWAGGADGEGWNLQSLRPPVGGPHGPNGDRKARKGGQADAFCPPAFDCNGVSPPSYHPNNYL